MCDFRVQSCRHRACAVVCLSWLLECFHCRKTGDEPDECVNPIIQTCWSTSLQALAPPHSRRRPPWCRWLPRRSSRVRASSWALAPSSPRHTVAPEDSPLRSVCQNSASDAPDASAAAALDALIDAARGVPIDDGIRYSTYSWYHHHTRATFVTQGSLGHDEHALPGWAFLAPAPSRAAARLVVTRERNQVHTVSE